MPASDDQLFIISYAHSALRLNARRRSLTIDEIDELQSLICKIAHRDYACWATLDIMNRAYREAIEDLDLVTPWE